MTKIIYTITLLLGLIMPIAGLTAPQVVVTLKPIHALVTGVMAGVETPYLLLSGGESPHSYSLRPSQLRKLHQADLLIWVGPSVETFLVKPLSSLNENKSKILALFELDGLTRLKARRGENWEIHHHDHHDNEAHQLDSKLELQEPAHEFDQHIWLDPHNAKMMVMAIAQILSQLDAINAERYNSNANQLITQLEKLDQELQAQLAPVKTIPFLVFHDAYHYLENRYGLTAVGSISLSPATSPSAQHLHQLRHRIHSLQVRCVFSEPQFESALVATVIDGTSTRRGILDPLGADLKPGTTAYFTLLRQLADSLRECLLESQ
jgi:zinc transport system substrate-binding protein